MKKKEWGPIIWNFLHTLSFKIHDETFESQKKNLITIVRLTFSSLPCPYCSQHALNLLKKINIKYINSKDSFIDFIYIFHNEVNKKLKKKMFSKKLLEEKYKNKNFANILNEFIQVYNYKSSNIRFNLTIFNNKKICNKIISIILSNKSHYNEKNKTVTSFNPIYD